MTELHLLDITQTTMYKIGINYWVTKTRLDFNHDIKLFCKVEINEQNGSFIEIKKLLFFILYYYFLKIKKCQYLISGKKSKNIIASAKNEPSLLGITYKIEFDKQKYFEEH